MIVKKLNSINSRLYYKSENRFIIHSMNKKRKFSYSYDLTLDLHGKTLEDSIYELEKNIYSGKFSSIMIVHGHGEGILRNGIRKYLAKNKFVKEVMYGEDLNMPGTSAITVIYL